MRDSIYRFTLDMHDISSQVQITVKKNDNARRIHVNLMENGRPFTIEPGCRAVIEIKKPDGNILFNDCDIVDSGNCISYEFTSQTATADGLCECEVRVFDSDNNVITSPRFTMLVTEQVYDEGQVESQSEFTSLVSTLSKALKLEEEAEQIYSYIDEKKTESEDYTDANVSALNKRISDEKADIEKKIDDQDSLLQDDINAKYSTLDSGLRSAMTRIDGKQDKLKQGDNIVIEADGTISAVMTSGTGEEAFDIVYANFPGYGEIRAWSDENPDAEDRMYRFVKASSGNTISIANDADQIFGVTESTTGFVVNAKGYDPKDTAKSVVTLIGIVHVKTEDITIVAGDMVMSDENGYAVRSSNSCGYLVLDVISDGLVSIVLNPNTDVIQRLKAEIDKAKDIINDETASVKSVYSSEKVNALLKNLSDSMREYADSINNNLIGSISNLSSSVDSRFSQVNEGLRTANTNIATKQNKPSTVSYTLLATNWTGADGAYSYDLATEYPEAQYDIEVLPVSTYTEEQKEAIKNATITGSSDNNLQAWGEKPAVDIPVELKVVTK